ncbi:MAG: PilW family protein [Burkholderiales bacterium]
MTRPPRRQRGAGIVETMIGILIGLLVVLVVYNLLAVAEDFRRTTTGAADAQITGLLSQFVTTQDAASAGNGLMSGYSDLIGCHKTEADGAFTTDVGAGPATLKPFPVLVYNGATAADPDRFVTRIGTSPHVIWPLDFRLPSPLAGQAITVSSPLGYSTITGSSLPTAARPYWAVAIANDGTGRCALIRITGATAPDATSGEVTLTQGSPATTIAYTGVTVTASTSGSRLLNLGSDAARQLYDVANGSLRITDCLATQTCQGAAANPIAQNVVWMKVQYGIDTTAQNANGTFDSAADCWTAAVAGTCTATNADGTTFSDWTPETLIKAGDATAIPAVRADVINRIVAVRIALVVRSDEPDLRNPSLYTAPAQTPDGTVGTRPPLYLFNCAANTDAGCQGRILVPAGAPSAFGKSDCAAAGKILCDGWRYRVYEAVIPLRNAIYNATISP